MFIKKTSKHRKRIRFLLCFDHTYTYGPMIVHGKGQHQQDLRKGSLKRVLLSTDRTRKPGSQHITGCHAANFALRHWGWAEKLWRDIPRPFQALSQLVLLRIKPETPTSEVGEITKFSLRRLHCKLLVCFFGWEGARRHWYRYRKYYILPALLHQFPYYVLKLGCHMLTLQSTLRPRQYFVKN